MVKQVVVVRMTPPIADVRFLSPALPFILLESMSYEGFCFHAVFGAQFFT